MDEMDNTSSARALSERLAESLQSNSRVGAIPTDVLKSVLIIALLAITLISSLIPFALRRAAISHASSVRRRHLFAGMFSLLSCFGGGVFLATCLLDLFPDTRDLIGEGLQHLGIQSDFPLAEFFVAIGFFIVLFIEQIVLYFREKRDAHVDHDESSIDSDQRRLITNGGEEGTGTSARVDRRRHTAPAGRRSGEGPLGTIANVPRQRVQSKPKDPAAVGVKPAGAASEQIESISASSSQEAERSGGEHQHSPSVVVISHATVLDDGNAHLPDEAANDIESIRTDVHFDPESHSTFRAVMLVMALSTHATFEGLALGLQVDASLALQIFGALCIHKCVIAFSLGMRLVQSRLTTLSIVGCCLLFCVSALIGGFIGLAISEAVKTSSAAMINGSLQGLACGTFLYITAFEILPHELNDEGHRLPKLLMLLAGFTVICVFVLLYPNS